MSEEWRDVVGYEGLYEVSNQGHVRSLWRETPRTLKPHMRPRPTNTGGAVARVCLYRGDGSSKVIEVHRLVLTAFDGPPPDGTECCHWDGDAANNHITNLYWGTRSQNVKDQARHQVHNMARKTHCRNGHEYTPENTRLWTDENGSVERICRACNNAACRRYTASGKRRSA